MRNKLLARVYGASIALFLLYVPTALEAKPLTLKQAEQIALAQSPEVKAFHAKASALGQAAIAADQFSDPKLAIGTLNMPVNSFNFSQSNMTQIQIALQQQFPKGRSLHYSSEVKKKLSLSEKNNEQLMQLHVLQGVRNSWLQLYLWQQNKRIISDQKRVFKHLLSVTKSMLENNKAQQMDVVRAQLEVSELDNRLIEVTQKIDEARSALARWVTAPIALKAKAFRIPRWSSPPSILTLNKQLANHPVIKKDSALMLAGKDGIKLAKQQYIPGFLLGVAYGIRQGEHTNGDTRSDFLTARLSFNLPFFTRNRQDRTLNASKQRYIANEQLRYSDYRNLRDTLSTQFAIWKQQRSSAWLYRSKLVPQAKQYAEATMTAYQNTQTDFPTLARAYIRELNTELGGVKAQVNQAIARVNLLYIQGQ
jgi:outer membrane protein TolC